MNLIAKLNPMVLHTLIISAVAGAIFFTHLGTAKLWDQDEPRNAGCAKEMLERGDWTVPIFNNQLRAQKPVLLYWLMMTAYSVLGVSEFSARFWSAALGLGTVLATYFIGRRLFNPIVGLISAIVLASCTMFVVAARAATPDSLLIFCGTMALLIYVRGTFSRNSYKLAAPKLVESSFPKRYLTVLGIYFFLGLGTLTKGPIGFLLPMAIMGMFMLLNRTTNPSPDAISNRFYRFTNWVAVTFHPRHFMQTIWKMRPVTAALVVLAVAAPWYVLVGVKTEGDFLNLFFLKENFARATSAMENHSGGIWFYPLAIMFGFFPWSVLTVPVVITILRTLRLQTESENTERNEASPNPELYRMRAVQFLVCWVVVQVGLFSLASTKLPSYVTPCFPALAILTGFFLHSMATNRNSNIVWFRLALGTLILGGIGMVAAMMFIGDKYLTQDYRLALLGAIPILGGAVGLYLSSKPKQKWAVGSLLITSVVLTIGVFGFGTVIVDQHRQTDDIFARLNESQRPIASFGILESSWVFYTDQPIHELVTDPAANQRRGQTLDRKRYWYRTPWVSPEYFIAQHPDAMILTTGNRAKSLLRRLPGYAPVETTSCFLKEDQLVLIGPAQTTIASGETGSIANTNLR